MRIIRRVQPSIRELREADEQYFRVVIEPLAVYMAQHFKLDLKKIEHKKFGQPDKEDQALTLGLCYPYEKRIRVLIRPYHRGRFCERLNDQTIIRTIAHELSHLKHPNHSKAHKDFENEIFNFIWYRKTL